MKNIYPINEFLSIIIKDCKFIIHKKKKIQSSDLIFMIYRD